MATRTPPSVETILTGFNKPILTPIEGRPNYVSLQRLRKELQGNATSIETLQGGGGYGHLALILPAATYDALPGAAAFPAPVAPPAQPVIPAAATAAMIADLRHTHADNVYTYRLYSNTHTALRNQLIDAVDNVYYSGLRHPITQYAQVTVLAILTHLFTAYAKITDKQLSDDVETELHKPWDPSIPLENFFDHFETNVDYYDIAGQPLSTRTQTRYAANAIMNANVHPDAVMKWLAKPEADMTYANVKAHFAAAENVRRIMQATGTTREHFAGHAAAAPAPPASHFQDLDDRMDARFAALLSTLAITTEPTPPPAPAPATTELLTALTALIASNNNNNGRNGRTPGNNNNRNQNGRQQCHPDHYCWTHGFYVRPDHNSDTCNNRNDGHQPTATGRNRQGGSERGIEKCRALGHNI